MVFIFFLTVVGYPKDKEIIILARFGNTVNVDGEHVRFCIGTALLSQHAHS